MPVPVDLAGEVHDYMVRRTFSAYVPDWNPAAVDGHLVAQVDDVRALVCMVAVDVAGGGASIDTELAARLDVSAREVHGLVQEANRPVLADHPGQLLWSRHVPDESEGSAKGTVCEVYMLTPIAETICEWLELNGPLQRFEVTAPPRS